LAAVSPNSGEHRGRRVPDWTASAPTARNAVLHKESKSALDKGLRIVTDEKTNIPRCMSTQHPDNVTSPFFAENSELGGEDEIQEAYYAFSHLGCDEQMWDCEGKEVDAFVVKKLLSKYESFFTDTRLGRDAFITLRVPNPAIERTEGKVLLETLESIPRSFDAARPFYGEETPPVFEVILPMTESAVSLDRVYRYYRDFVAGKQDKPLANGGTTIAEWVGEFRPSTVNVIPLFETMEDMLGAHEVVREYLQDKEVEYQRVFLARSDPGMNYGQVAAVLLNKIALQRLYRLSQEIGVRLHPIVGVGSAPFRGNLRPDNVDKMITEYPSTHTFTIQSAFKYDYPPEQVREAIRRLRDRETGIPPEVDEEGCLRVIEKYSAEYTRQVETLAPLINHLARSVPSRRKRKLHIGLFGYSRSMGKITLPRAIQFTAALYSIGLPPELLGLNALTREDIRFVKEAYANFEEDLRDAVRYLNVDTGFVPKEVARKVEECPGLVPGDEEHRELTSRIAASVKESAVEDLSEYVVRAASLRRFLG
jgi:phosphoenolpyruvate carboxylase